MSKYYCLVAGLPDIHLEDTKLSYTVADFRTEIYPDLSSADKKLIDLFYLKFDNRNLIKLLDDKDAVTDNRGNYTGQELLDLITQVRDGVNEESLVYPTYLIDFISYYYSENNDDNAAVQEDYLSSLYFEYAMRSKNEFIVSWFEFNLNLNNILAALVSRKYKQDVARSIVGNTDVSIALKTSGARDFGLTGEVDYFEPLLKMTEVDDLVEREKKIDILKWKWLENATFFNYFTIERIFAFLLQLEMVERWILMDKERGSKLFRQMIDSLKNDVQIPVEFR